MTDSNIDTKMSTSRLFQPLTLGNITLQHRLVMAPLTRFRADDKYVPLPMVSEYYSQRASVPGTLLVTEATFISPRATGYRNVPGIWSDAQIASWRSVTSAVHERGSYIFLQLWALGRVADPDVLREAEDGPYEVVGASAIPESSKKSTPKPLTAHEIQQFVNEYATAAHNAVHLAGFDGVEIHGANGYLVDQFIQSNSNQRSDEYGGTIAKRSRFALEVTKAVADAVGPERVGIRLSPYSRFQGMRMADDAIIPQFSHVVSELAKLDIAYVHLVEGRVQGPSDDPESPAVDNLDFAVSAWSAAHPNPTRSPVLIAGGFKPDTAAHAVDTEYKDSKVGVAVVFGRYFISNPDLPYRIQQGISLNHYDRSTFYKKGSPLGYVDYPFSEQFLQSELASRAHL